MIGLILVAGLLTYIVVELGEKLMKRVASFRKQQVEAGLRAILPSASLTNLMLIAIGFTALKRCMHKPKMSQPKVEYSKKTTSTPPFKEEKKQIDDEKEITQSLASLQESYQSTNAQLTQDIHALKQSQLTPKQMLREMEAARIEKERNRWFYQDWSTTTKLKIVVIVGVLIWLYWHRDYFQWPDWFKFPNFKLPDWLRIPDWLRRHKQVPGGNRNNQWSSSSNNRPGSNDNSGQQGGNQQGNGSNQHDLPQSGPDNHLNGNQSKSKVPPSSIQKIAKTLEKLMQQEHFRNNRLRNHEASRQKVSTAQKHQFRQIPCIVQVHTNTNRMGKPNPSSFGLANTNFTEPEIEEMKSDEEYSEPFSIKGKLNRRSTKKHALRSLMSRPSLHYKHKVSVKKQN